MMQDLLYYIKENDIYLEVKFNDKATMEKYLSDSMNKISGMVGLAAVRMRRKVWAIGLNQEAVTRHGGGRRPYPLGIREADRAREGDVIPQCAKLARHLGTPRIAMEDANNILELAHDVHTVAVGIAVMDHDGEREVLGHLHLCAEDRLLAFSVAIVIMIVQPDLPDRHGA